MTRRDEPADDGLAGRDDTRHRWRGPTHDQPTARMGSDGPADDPLPDLRPGDEPVAGYRLVAPLGSGATGVVWEAVGPGGFPSALKFTRLGPKRTHELASLDLVRGLRHAHLLPVFGAWEKDGYLVVGMELADGTLSDRLARAQRRGLPGIPFPELIEYMAQAARGIDFLNGPGRPGGGVIGVRHCDVKPQNLLLVGDAVKVGDFGLARADGHPGSDGSRESLTPAFAAPEVARNRPTDRSDQYSLAVTYVLLRGGRLPFGGTAWSMLMDHAAAAPDLSMIPAAERPVVARAMAKRPADRWADCREFVRELARVGGGAVPKASRHGRRRRLLVTAGVGVCGLGLLHLLFGANVGRGPRPDREPARAAETATLHGAVPRRVVTGPATAPPPRVRGESVALTVAPGPRPARVAATTADLAVQVAAARGWAEVFGRRSVRGADDVARAVGRGVAAAVPAVEWRVGPVALEAGPRPAVRPALALAPPPRAARPVPRTATIYVRMPAADAELVVRGEVGRGNPDEWYGATRVIHTPPMAGPADYVVGAFWSGPGGRTLDPRVELRVEPGRVYEVVLRGPKPSSRDVTDKPPPSNREAD